MQKRGNTMYKNILILLIILLVLPNVSAIKILMGSDNKVFFEPNLAREFTFTVSEAERPATVPIALKGSMAKYATVEPSVLDMVPGDKKEIKIKLQLPETIDKGVHALEVSATEKPKDAQTGSFIWIPAVAATLKIINTDVDYDCSLGMFTASMGAKSARITLNAASAGRLPTTAYADLAIYNAEGASIASWKTGNFEIPPYDSKTIESSTEFKEMPPGSYNIKGTLFCGEKRIELSSGMLNPATSLKINDFTAYKKDGSLYIGFDLENEYDAPINTYGIAWFYKDGKEVDHTGFTAVTVPPKGKAILGISPKLEWVPLPPGTYTVKGDITYLGNNEQREATFTLTEEDLAKKEAAGGFTMGQQQEQKPAEEPQQIVLEQPSSEGMSNKTLVRIIAGLLILILITVFILKVLAAKRE